MASINGAGDFGSHEGVARLVHKEGLRIDTDPILRLQSNLGPQGAARYIREAREELLDLLSLVRTAHEGSSFNQLASRCNRAGSLGLQLGFPGLRNVAANASDAAESGDAAATAATVGRLLRLGLRAVEEMGELQSVVLR